MTTEEAEEELRKAKELSRKLGNLRRLLDQEKLIEAVFFWAEELHAISMHDLAEHDINAANDALADGTTPVSPRAQIRRPPETGPSARGGRAADEGH